MRNIVFFDEAEKDMKRLDPSVRLQVLKGIQKVAKNPLSADQGGYNERHRTGAFSASVRCFSIGLFRSALSERQAVSRFLNLNMSCSAISFRISVSIRSRKASSSSGSNCVPRPRIISPRIVSGGRPLR